MMNIFKSKSALFGAMALSALAIVATSCDNVDEKDRLIDYPLPEASKNLLIMEFTGQSCINCPNGASVIKDLQSAYEENIIAVCLHPENVQFTDIIGNIDLGLRSQTATQVYQVYKPNSFPFAVFDGMVLSQSEFYLQWSAAATKLVNAETPVIIEAEAEYDADRNIIVKAKADFVRGEYQGPLNIAVWIMENGIVGPQQSTSGRLKTYTHNHVLRTSFNGTWGQPLGNSFSLGDVKEYTTSIADAPADWKLENCQIVVFLVDPSSKYVVQAVEAELEESN